MKSVRNLNRFAKLLFVSFSFCNISLGKMVNDMPKSITVDIFNIPAKLSHRILGSASDYIITAQCLRTLVRMGKSGQIEGDLAEAWTISKDQRTYTFSIKKGLKFSNGDEIRPRDVSESLDHPEFKKTAIHFDFSNIESIESQNNLVVIRLKRPDPHFISHLTQPEFGTFHVSDRGAEPAKLKVTSGPFYIEKSSHNEVILKENPYRYEEGPKEVRFVALKQSKFQAIKNGKVDMALLWEDPSKELYDSFVKSGHFDILKPHIGFTFWITLNPNSGAMKDFLFRRKFQTVLKSYFVKSFSPTASWEVANQLFLPGGPGRISDDWLNKFWLNEPKFKGKKEKIVVKGLLSKGFQFSSQLKKAIEVACDEMGLDLKITTYENQTEFMNKLKDDSWDFYAINNDFSSYELVKNLIVTFNKEKPLIQFPKNERKIQELWDDVRSSILVEQRYANTEKLAKMLLSEALIVPLVYKNIPILKRKEIDLSAWSHLFPEFSFWKVRFKK